MHSSKLRELNNIVHLTWQKRGGGVRSGERGRECVKEAAGRAALKGGEGELEGVEGGSATLEGGEEEAARLWRAGSWRHKVSSMQTLFHQHSWHSNVFVIFNFLLVPMLIGLFPIVCIEFILHSCLLGSIVVDMLYVFSL